jgi:hypothetical protein
MENKQQMAELNGIVEIPLIGHKYHVTWAGSEPAFRLIDLGKDYAVIKADSKKKVMATLISDLRHTRASADYFNKQF